LHASARAGSADGNCTNASTNKAVPDNDDDDDDDDDDTGGYAIVAPPHTPTHACAW
jgi:hypothetical protein